MTASNPAFPWSRVHFIGIGGVGMSATAKLLRDAGVVVSGSDEAVYPPVSDFLREAGLACATPYAGANIPVGVEAFVIGRNARLVPERNEEVRAAFASGRPILSFAQVLGLLAHGRQRLVVAGAFGKTTSVSMMAHCLLEAGLDPSFMIGAAPLTPPVPARLGDGPHFLLEGDEYPSSNSDDRSKFLHYHPDHLLVAPLAHDHVNVFPTPDDYLAPFSELIDMLPPEGVVVAARSGPLSAQFLARCRRPVVTFGIDAGDWQVRDIEWGARSRFTIVHEGRDVVRVETGQLGVHNIENMLGVGAFLLTLGVVGAETFAWAMGSFAGVRRRLDRKSERTSIPVYEGFGSSCDKACSAIAAMRLHFPDRRLAVVFEPHAFSWRNRATLHWYDNVFAGAAHVFVWPPAQQGAGDHDQVGQEEIVARISASGCAVTALRDRDSAAEEILRNLDADGALLFLTSGDLGGLIAALPPLIEQRFPAQEAVQAFPEPA